MLLHSFSGRFFLLVLYPQFYVKKVLNQYRNHPKTFSQNGHAFAWELFLKMESIMFRLK